MVAAKNGTKKKKNSPAGRMKAQSSAPPRDDGHFALEAKDAAKVFQLHVGFGGHGGRRGMVGFFAPRGDWVLGLGGWREREKVLGGCEGFLGARTPGWRLDWQNR